VLECGAMRHFLVFATVAVLSQPAWASPERDAASHYDKGKRAFDDGDFTKAIDELKASVAAKPTAKAYLLLGNAYTKVGQLDEAKKAFEGLLKADPNSPKKKLVENLIREMDVLAKTKLMVTSTPPGATVFLDLRADGPRGKTPLELPATPGLHRVMLDLEGYEPGVANATAVEGSQVPVAIALKPKAGTVVEEKKPEPPKKGLLALKAPQGASVAVDGRDVSVEAAAKMELEPGEHVVEVKKEGMAPWHVSAVIKAGEKLDLQPRLDVGGGTTGVEVFAEPARATIRVDGNPVRNAETVPLPPGDHTVAIRAIGHFPVERQLHIVAGERAHLEARLEPRGRALLYVGLGAAALAVAAEAVALTGRAKAGDQLAGSSSWSDWHNVELGGQIAAGTLGAVAIGTLVGFIVTIRSGGDEAPRTRVTATPLPSGGALVLTRSF